MPIDVEKLALEAGGTKERDEVFGPHYVMSVDALERFAALVLEAAAVQCDTKHEIRSGDGFAREASTALALAKEIRAMKQGESNE